MPFGSGDSLDQTIRLLVEVGGLTEADALNSLVAKLRQEQKLTAEAMRDAKAPADEMVRAVKQYETQIQSLLRSLASLGKVQDEAVKSSQEWLDMQEALRAASERTARATTEAAEATALAAKQGVDLVRASIEADDEWLRMKQALGDMDRKAAAEAHESARDRVTQHASATAAIKEQEAAAEKAAERRREDAEDAIRLEMAMADAVAEAERKETAEREAAAEKRRKAQEQEIDRTSKAADRAKASWLDAYDRSEKAAKKAADAIKAYEEDKSRTNKAKAEAAIEQAERAADAEVKAANKRKVAAVNALNAIEDAERDATDALQEYRASLNAVDNATQNVAKAANQSQTAFSKESWGEKNAVGILHVAHAFQDLQYGVGAVLNNIPLLAQAFDVPAQYAGGLMIAAVGLNLAWEHGAPLIREYASAMGLVDDKTKGVVRTADEAKAKIDALTAKRHKLDVDYENIRRAKEEADALNEAVAAFDASKKTDEQGVMAGEAKGVVEGFGGSKAFADIIEAAAAGKGAFTHAEPSDPEFQRYQRLKAMRDAQRAHGNADMADAHQREMDKIEAVFRDRRRTDIENEVGRFLAGDDVAATAMARRAQAGLFPQAGPGGLTANEAILGMTSVERDANGNVVAASRQTVRRRLDSDAEAALDEEANAENLKRFKDARRAAADRQKELDRIRDRDAKAQDEEEAAGRKIEEEDAKHRQRVFEAGLKAAGQADHQKNLDEAKAAREAARDARNAPKEAQRAQEADLAKRFQAATGATDDQAAEAGREMAKLVDRGATIPAAMNQVFAQIQRNMISMAVNTERTLAMIEAMNGAFGPHSAELQRLEAMLQQAEMQLRMVMGAGRTRRPSRLPRGN